MNIYNWLPDNARKMPEKVCLRYKDQEITFAELYSLTSALGTSLRKAGIKRGDHITLVLPNIPEFVISYMGIIGIGAVVTPVNPSFTSRELGHILIDSDSKAIIIEEGDIGTYQEIQDQYPQDIVITIGEEGNFSQWVTGEGEGIIEDMDEDDTAVMIYSSGLTGFPMGAMLTQKNLDHNSDLVRICLNGDNTDTTLTLIPCFHSFSASANLLSMLRLGGTAYLMKKLDFKELHHALTQGGITLICAVPTLFYGLLYHPEMQDIDYTRTKALIAGGSALSIDIFNEFKQRFHTEIRQGYGITEASPVCAANNVHVKNKPESIGPCVPGVEAKVVDDDGNTLAAGETGEILFKGPNIMKGYYKKPKETEEVLKDGWLYTGDLGYMDEEGYIYITGYKKDMIITSGFNVYCQEVINVLNSIPGVKDSAVSGIPDLMRGAIIKAYVVVGDPDLTENEVKKKARKMLASYKTPRKVIFVESIPRDSNGRVLIGELDKQQ
ncbi:MAG: AMP-binding protein [Deltaproteobacteria bacterium]|nr:AMP-binding protein [Deltaproteobacteria bacterium]